MSDTSPAPTSDLRARAAVAAEARLRGHLARFLDGPDVAIVPTALRGETSHGAYARMSPAQRAAVILPVLIEQQLPFVEKEDKRRAAATARAERRAATRAAAATTISAAPTKAPATNVPLAKVTVPAPPSTGRYFVSCATGCGRMLPTRSPRPVIRRCPAVCVPVKGKRS